MTKDWPQVTQTCCRLVCFFVRLLVTGHRATQVVQSSHGLEGNWRSSLLFICLLFLTTDTDRYSRQSRIMLSRFCLVLYLAVERTAFKSLTWGSLYTPRLQLQHLDFCVEQVKHALSLTNCYQLLMPPVFGPLIFPSSCMESNNLYTVFKLAVLHRDGKLCLFCSAMKRYRSVFTDWFSHYRA